VCVWSNTTTIRVSEQTRATAADLARQSGQSMQAIVEEALTLLRKERSGAQWDAGFTRLNADVEVRAGYDAERVESTPAGA